MGVRDDVLPHVGTGAGERRTARQIWESLGIWSPVTVRNVLERLAKEGAIVRTVEPIPSGFIYRYHREA